MAQARTTAARMATRYLSILVLVVLGCAVATYYASGFNQKAPSPHDGQSPPKESFKYVFGSYYDLKVSKYRIFPKKKMSDGGGLELIANNEVLLSTGNGEFYILHIADNDVSIDKLDITSPIDVLTHRKQNPDAVPQWFRVTDILLDPQSSQQRPVYAATTYWNQKDNCYTLRISENNMNLDNKTAGDWVTRYETDPCRKSKLNNQTGGRLAFLDKESILASISTFFDNPIGKIVELNRSDWKAKTFTSGHRNPQGLLVDSGEIWETEHGPHGGDELNLLELGKDYGWPKESYGTNYGNKTFNKAPLAGDHSRTTRPVYAWIPSIGVSNLIRLHGDAFPAWKGDLIIASLSGQGNGNSLYRVRIREGRAVSAERFRIGDRIRDLVELADGRIVVWNGRDTIRVIEPANHVFSACAGCHALRRTSHRIGPDLMGVVGSKVARHKGYDYSSALAEFGGKWTPARLDAFLADPQATVPGTKMDYPGLPDRAQRKEVVRYLQGLRLPGGN